MPHPFLDECLAILSRTPATLDSMLRGLPSTWIDATDGPDTWSAHTIVGHLIHGERTDWIPRLEIILQFGPDRPFDPFDREAQFRESANTPLPPLLDEFTLLRGRNLDRLRDLDLQPHHLGLQGTHPALGPVTLRQLLATWTAHDLAHILQISRTMARRLKQDVGPWAEYLSVMR